MIKTTRRLALLLAAAILVTACTAQQPAQETAVQTPVQTGTAAASEAPETTAQTTAADTTPAPAESTEEAETPAPAESMAPASDGDGETSADNGTNAETTPAESTEAIPASVSDAPAEAFLPLPVGSFSDDFDLSENGEAVGAAEIESLERAMRAYSHPYDSPLVNDAPLFYYYEQLSAEQQKIYDAILMAAEDPSGSFYVCYQSPVSPDTTAFCTDVQLVFNSVIFDHPELFHLYEQKRLFWNYDETAGAPWAVYFFMKAYPDFYRKTAVFNKAVNSFLSDIDTSGSQLEIARRVHDKLIASVSYDRDLADRNVANDLGHTAYGALVANSAGEPFHAVCDGYSLAYNYLLQQLGIPAVLMVGWAGPDETGSGRHAWSLICCDGKWLEVDATWDDFGNTIERLTKDNSKWLDYWLEIYENASLRDLREHYLFAVPTATIRNYKAPAADSIYVSKDRLWRFHVLTDSVHVRYTEREPGAPLGILTGSAPVSK